MIRKISAVPVTGKYLVWYVPKISPSMSRWVLARYDSEASQWYLYGEVKDREFKITHWAELPPAPPENECNAVKGFIDLWEH